MDKQTDREQCFIGPSTGRESKNSNLEQSGTLIERENNNLKLNSFIKTLAHTSNIHYSNINQKKETEKTIYNYFLWNYKKMRLPRHLVQLSIWKSRLGILDILDIKTYKNKAMRIFLRGCLILAYISPKKNLPTILTNIEEILEQPIILNPHTKLSFSSNNLYS